MNPKEGEEKHYKSVKYKLYPNSSQEKIMVETVGYCGSLYNTVLNDEIEYFLKTGKKRSVF
ncbi:MAG: helix-turn-helix domain-containing protein, partial [Candidatus Methanomethylophilaceae archaeon]|nr:helix-turn-helix domain-containing protein [Candidatus Methanomethylophilaceae archaeon]